MRPVAHEPKVYYKSPVLVPEPGGGERGGVATNQVVLAWDHLLQGARDTRNEHNVVMHEFAHKLVEENVAMDGLPLVATAAQ
jgi:Mlc titration factor MtfA (ptsG expression regulator)